MIDVLKTVFSLLYLAGFLTVAVYTVIQMPVAILVGVSVTVALLVALK